MTNENANTPSTQSRQDRNRDRMNARQQATGDADFRGRYLIIQPGDQLVFENKGTDKDSTDFITLSNTTTGFVAFKVKTTAPEKFRVKPSFGCIAAGESRSVEITIQQGFLLTAQRDKFLVMSASLEEVPKNQNELIEFWHDVLQNDSAAENVEEHRLRCQILTSTDNHVDAGDNRRSDRSDRASIPGQSAEQMPAIVMEKLEAINAKVDRLMALHYEGAHSSSFMSQWNVVTVGFAVVVMFVGIHLIKLVLGV